MVGIKQTNKKVVRIYYLKYVDYFTNCNFHHVICNQSTQHYVFSVYIHSLYIYIIYLLLLFINVFFFLSYNNWHFRENCGLHSIFLLFWQYSHIFSWLRWTCRYQQRQISHATCYLIVKYIVHTLSNCKRTYLFLSGIWFICLTYIKTQITHFV